MKFGLDRNDPPRDPFQHAQNPLVLLLLSCSWRAGGEGGAGFLCDCIMKGSLLCKIESGLLDIDNVHV